MLGIKIVNEYYIWNLNEPDRFYPQSMDHSLRNSKKRPFRCFGNGISPEVITSSKSLDGVEVKSKGQQV